MTGFAKWKTYRAWPPALFADQRFGFTAANPDIRLRLDSRAIGPGAPGFLFPNGQGDLENGHRLTGLRADIGADELSPYTHRAFSYVGTGFVLDDLIEPENDPENDG